MRIIHIFQAWVELFKRYKNTFKFFWERRDEMKSKDLSEEESEFLPASLSIQEKPTSPTMRWVARIIILMVGFVLAWSIIGKIDVVVNANGKVISIGNSKTISAIEVARVDKIFVNEGMFVKKGELLLELNTDILDAEKERAQADLISATINKTIAQNLIIAVKNDKLPLPTTIHSQLNELPLFKRDEAYNILKSQFMDYYNKKSRYDDEITNIKILITQLSKIVKDLKQLQDKQLISLHSYLEKEQSLTEYKGKLVTNENERQILKSETQQKAFEVLREATHNYETAQKDVMRASSRKRIMQVESPVDGTVQQLTVHTIGGVVPAAQPLMNIVPKNAAIEIEAFVENKDVGFVKEKQRVAIKFDAFEYTKYGTVDGEITHVSRDSINDEKRGLIYSLRIKLKQGTIEVDGKDTEISPGMSINAEIKIGTRRVIEYLLSPLMRYKRESLNER